jgi:hypothetical protein
VKKKSSVPYKGGSRQAVPQLPQQLPPLKTVEIVYEHLTADQAEQLKQKVTGKESEYVWGTYGPNRDEELQKYSIDTLSTQHLENILITCHYISNELAAAILMLLKKRYDKYGALR